jgi:hypothetical protein
MVKVQNLEVMSSHFQIGEIYTSRNIIIINLQSVLGSLQLEASIINSV